MRLWQQKIGLVRYLVIGQEAEPGQSHGNATKPQGTPSCESLPSARLYALTGGGGEEEGIGATNGGGGARSATNGGGRYSSGSQSVAD